ncbi:hypothetical protein Bca52824_014494 [Brassica carinata]|uniref:Hexosyltransferase n=1 Tax=Brassica carinata TaxID=52824 RepID=A0A8X7W1H2_BRACI|nr:hypothetical protein Bca52824_014494 [Brassica carinata]
MFERDTRTENVSPPRLNFTEEVTSASSFARQLAEQMTLAKSYLSSKIRSCQLLLSKAAMRGQPISLDEAKQIVSGLSALIYKAQDAHYDIATTMMTMKSHIQALEERANAATVQTTVFGQSVAEAIPKSLHCLMIKLTSDWLTEQPSRREVADENRNSPRLVDNNLYHFCIFTDNVIAASVVVNSTVSNADHPKQLVFHIVTNRVSYKAMQAWFLGNDFKGSAIEIQSVEEFSWLNASYSPVVKQLQDTDSRAYYFGDQETNSEPKVRNPKYLSLLNHLRFYIPEIYPQLEKIVFLDDDVVVQKDLTPLFSLDLHGNVNGAVETCLEAFHRYYKYLNFSDPLISSKFDPQACGWAFRRTERTLWKLGTLPPGLLAFYGLTEPLDRRWHVLGLGYDVNIDNRLIETAAVIHYNGNMKPWLKIAIGRYKPFWLKFLNSSHPYLQDCVPA